MVIKTWQDGEILFAADLNNNFDTIQNDWEDIVTMPIGTLQFWHKSKTNTPTLPFGWAECNGQVLDDEESVYNNQQLPDLNNNNRFLRGATTSGDIGGALTHGHGYGGSVSNTNRTGSASSYYGLGAASNIPRHITMVVIMRVK